MYTNRRNKDRLCVEILVCSNTLRISEEIKLVFFFNGSWNAVIINKLWCHLFVSPHTVDDNIHRQPSYSANLKLFSKACSTDQYIWSCCNDCIDIAGVISCWKVLNALVHSLF